MNSVKRNIVANYLGGAWTAVMGIAFVPLYVRYLGIEAYGLIGLFTLLQSWLTLLDMGLNPTLSREMARFQAGTHTSQSIRDLMRSVQRVYLVIAFLVALVLFLGASWLAKSWVHAEKLSTATVASAFAVSGIIIGARWIVGLYRSALNGLQRQVWLNVCAAAFSTVRGLGAVAILAWGSSTIMGFFVYQGVCGVIEALVLGIRLHGLLPTPPEPARFRWEALRRIWRFAAGMAAITLLSILLMQVDKLLLSKFLSLRDFGYYILASTVSGALSLVIGPINNAIYPRVVEFVARRETLILAEAYHKFSQMLTLMLVPAALVLSLFSQQVLLLWTHDANTTLRVAPLVSILTIGTMLNGLMHTPYTLQLAYGWTRFTVVVNTISVIIIVPLIYVGIRAYGAIAAAYIWAILNAGYIIFAVPVMHRKLLSKEMWSWYGQDVFLPTFAVLAVLGLLRALMPAARLDRPWESALTLTVASVLSFLTAVVMTPLGRSRLNSCCRPFLRAMCY